MQGHTKGKLKVSKRMMDCLSATAWGMKHFSGISTSRSLPLSVMRRCVDAGLCRCVGRAVLCDGDGFTVEPERYADGYVLTDEGQAVLNEHNARCAAEMKAALAKAQA